MQLLVTPVVTRVTEGQRSPTGSSEETQTVAKTRSCPLSHTGGDEIKGAQVCWSHSSPSSRSWNRRGVWSAAGDPPEPEQETNREEIA